jgi:Cu-Zn family superoxide dismutase
MQMTQGLLIVTGSLLLAACSTMGSMFGPTATAVLAPTKGHQVTGTVQFRQRGDAVLIEAKVNGLNPNGTHGFHIHEKGDCSASDASSAGGHFNPTGMPHGGPGAEKRHGGDLGNLMADANGFAQATIEVKGITLAADSTSVIGRAVIVHASPDDLKSQPAGNAGARLACGLISKNPDSVF